MKRLCIIPCGAKKIWDVDPSIGPSAAKDVYLSPFHRACGAYAQTFCGLGDSFSKTRFLKPEDIVPENYDVTFGMDHPEIMADDELKAQGERKKLDGL